MKTATATQVRAAWRRERDLTKRLLSRRRPQLLFAVLVGVIIGGGLTAVASVGLSGYEHGDGAGMSVPGQPGGRPGGFDGHFGPDSDH